MNTTFLQLQFIENVNKNFRVTYLSYGFYSNGDIAVLCSDHFGEFSITVNKEGETI